MFDALPVKPARYAAIFQSRFDRVVVTWLARAGPRRMSDKQLPNLEGRRRDASPGGTSQQLRSSPKRPFPAVRLLEDETSLTVLASVPGFTRDDLSITLERGGMTLVGRERAHVPEGFRAVLRQRVATDFSCHIELGEAVIGFAADARIEHGVLSVRLQKRGGSTRTLIPLRCT